MQQVELFRLCKQCLGPIPPDRKKAMYCGNVCNSAAYRERHPERQKQSYDKWYASKGTANRRARTAKGRQWRENNRDLSYKINKRSSLMRKYGLSLEDHQRLYEKQNGCCAGCKRPKPIYGRLGLCVDHCHTTGAVRQLLCSKCNMIVGLIETDMKTIIRLIIYADRGGLA